MFPNVNGALFLQKVKKVLHFYWILQRFLNAIFDLRNIKFSHEETQDNGKSNSRSENIVFPNVNGALFKVKKVIRFHWKTQCFQNAIFDLRDIKVSRGES